ncbi:MAG: hypothetical protein KGS72_01230 [Cyanobacteria bacterium REEB67]|nr:hypothetical protein [Cyanobacteria bacterium REEB67]
MKSLPSHQYTQAVAAVESENVSLGEKIEMLMEIAMGLQQRPKSAQQLLDAVNLYNRALELCPEEAILFKARLQARKATALQMIPSEEAHFLMDAQKELEVSLPVFEESNKQDLPGAATKEEIAEVQMNLGLVLQSLAGFHKAKITDAIFWYQRALRVFTKEAYPAEYAILHNNLATAYLSIPFSDEKAKMREALAVQSFEAALEVVTIEDMPSEYAMLQNNLGNALQYVSSSHAVENNLRALTAYDEALRVREFRTAPLAYANTIANKANCLRNLPDDPENPQAGNSKRLAEAAKLLKEAQVIFKANGEFGKAQSVAQTILELEEAGIN